MRAFERSRRRRLLFGKAMRGIAEPLFLWHDQPRVERALRDGRALDGGRVTVRLERTRYWCTYHRHCEMLGPEILVFVPAALCERLAQRFDARAGTSAGQPTQELVGRVTVVVSGNPAVFF